MQDCEGVVGEEGAVGTGGGEAKAHVFGCVFHGGGGDQEAMVDAGQHVDPAAPGFFAQNLGDAYRRDIVEDNRLYVPAGQGRAAFLDVRDAGEVTAKVFENTEPFRAKALTLTGPEAITFEQVAELLTSVLGRTVRYEAASVAGYAWHLHSKRQMSWMQVAVQTFLHFGLRHSEAERVDPTVTELLGKPARSTLEYVERAAATWLLPRRLP